MIPKVEIRIVKRHQRNLLLIKAFFLTDYAKNNQDFSPLDLGIIYAYRFEQQVCFAEAEAKCIAGELL